MAILARSPDILVRLSAPTVFLSGEKPKFRPTSGRVRAPLGLYDADRSVARAPAGAENRGAELFHRQHPFVFFGRYFRRGAVVGHGVERGPQSAQPGIALGPLVVLLSWAVRCAFWSHFARNLDFLQGAFPQ